MDPAWAGVVGGGIGVFGTLTAAVFGQWRAEKQRAADREAEDERWRRQQAADLSRWQMERHYEHRRATADLWEETRRPVYLQALRAAVEWYEGLIKLHTQHEVMNDLRASTDLRGNFGADTQEFEKFLTQVADVLPSVDGMDDCKQRLRATLNEIWAIAADPELGIVARNLSTALSGAQHVMAVPDQPFEEVDKAFERVREPMSRFMNLARRDLGLIDGPLQDSLFADPPDRTESGDEPVEESEEG